MNEGTSICNRPGKDCRGVRTDWCNWRGHSGGDTELYTGDRLGCKATDKCGRKSAGECRDCGTFRALQAMRIGRTLTGRDGRNRAPRGTELGTDDWPFELEICLKADELTAAYKDHALGDRRVVAASRVNRQSLGTV